MLLDDHTEYRHVGILLPCHESFPALTRSHVHSLLSQLNDMIGQNLNRCSIAYDSDDDDYYLVEDVCDESDTD